MLSNSKNSTPVPPRGFTLIEVVVSLVISMTIFYFALSTGEHLQRTNRETQFKAGLTNARLNLMNLLGHRGVWTTTVQKNSSMSCLLPSGTGNCTGVIGGSFAVFDVDGQKIYDPSVATQGFSRKGLVCQNFGNRESGSYACPVHYNLTWTPICPSSGKCIRPNVKILAEAVIESSDSVSTLNSSYFGFALIK